MLQRAAGRGDAGKKFEQSGTSHHFMTDLKAVILNQCISSKIILKYIKRTQRRKQNKTKNQQPNNPKNKLPF